MKLPPFTLVHRLDALEEGGAAGHAAAERRTLLESAADPIHIKLASSLKRGFYRTLVNTSFAHAPAGSDVRVVYNEALPAWEYVLADMGRGDKVVTVGLWELGTHAGYLPWLIEQLNAAQTLFTFFKIQAAIPSGIVSRPERVKAWARRLEEQGYIMPLGDSGGIAENIIAEDFYGRAELVRKEIGVDYLVGVTSSMVAGSEDGEVYWNHLAVSHGRTILASAHGMHALAQKAGRPYEVAIGMIAVAQLLVTLNSRLDYHKDRGCIFDYNLRHAAIVKSIRRPMIEDYCHDLMAPRYRDAAEALVAALGAYKRSTHESADAPAPVRDADPA